VTAARREDVDPSDAVAVVVLTHGRVHLLRQCVENVLTRASAATREIVIWDNGSTDGTKEYLESLDDPRLRVVFHPENIGLNAYIEAFALTRSPFLLELDDDMIDAPQDWDLTLLRAFQRLPDVGFLGTSLVDNPHDVSAHAMYHIHKYTRVEESEVALLLGPTGGGCAMTSREVYDLVGGFPAVFFGGDAHFVAAVERAGYRAATMADLKLLHAGSPHYAKPPQEKVRYWQSYQRRVERKVAVKRVLLRLPGVAKLNSRYGWYESADETDAALSGVRRWLEEAKRGG
jgi:GT2 family glycosyltransferase